jgi:hypothetical protein
MVYRDEPLPVHTRLVLLVTMMSMYVVEPSYGWAVMGIATCYLAARVHRKHGAAYA